MNTATNTAYSAQEIRERYSKVRTLKEFALAITIEPETAQTLIGKVKQITQLSYPLEDILSIYVELLALKENITPSMRKKYADLPSVQERAVRVLHFQYGHPLEDVARIVQIREREVQQMVLAKG